MDRRKFIVNAKNNIRSHSTSLHTVSSLLNNIGYEKESKVILNTIGDFK